MYPAGWAVLGSQARLRLELYGQQAWTRMHHWGSLATWGFDHTCQLQRDLQAAVPFQELEDLSHRIQVYEVVRIWHAGPPLNGQCSALAHSSCTTARPGRAVARRGGEPASLLGSARLCQIRVWVTPGRVWVTPARGGVIQPLRALV